MLQGSAKVLFFPALLMAISSLADPTDLVINEILADPPDDANGDGVANTSQDEFVEIVNTGSANVDLGGFRLKDGFGIRHEFPSPTVLCSGQAIVIFGGGSPTGGFSGAVVQQASSGMLGLNNGGDTVTLEDDIGAFLTSVSYGSEGGQDQSLTRNPDLSGSFSQHTSVSSTAYSPGTKVDGTPFDACEPGEPTPSPTASPTETPSLVMIHEIQGTKSNDGNGGDVSPLEGQLVVVEAIVVGAFLGADKLNGFFLQEEDDDVDNDPRSSEGIFVYYPVPVDGVNALNEGDKVLLAGKVAEYYSQTQLSNVIMIQVISSNNPLPTPAAIDFQKDSYGVFSTSGGYVADLERFEGMSVRFASNSDMVVNEIYNFVRYGELVLTDGMVPIQFSQSNFPSKSGYDFYLRSIAARQVTLDDGSTNQNPDLSTYPGLDGIFDTENAIRIGDRPDSDLVGCLGYSFSQYRVHPTGSFHFKREDHRPKLKRGAKGKKGEFSIVSANVLNYFVTLDENGNTSGPGDLEPRGADSAAEFDRQSEKLVTALLSLNSDIFGLLEIENDFGETSTGNAVKALVEKLNAAGKDTYDWVRPKQDGVDKTFVDTSDAISNAFIYKSSSFTVAGVNILTDSNIPVAFTDALPIFDGSGSNRATIAVTFEGNNDRRNLRDAIGHRSLSLFSQSSSDDGNDDRECITIALCHFKSKGSVSEGEGNQDARDGAGNNNAIRLLASQAVAEWLKGNPTGVDCPNVMIMGDLNAYFKEDPVQYFLNNGYNSLVKEDEGSFVFDGYWGSLDYQLYNEDLFEKVKNFEKIQYNSFESLGLDYNLDFGRPSTWFDGSVPYRFSDHDPLVTTVKL